MKRTITKRNPILLCVALLTALALSACSAPDAKTAANGQDSAAPTDAQSEATATPAPTDAPADAATPEATPEATKNQITWNPESKKLIVGLDDTFAPMGFRDTSNALVGFDIDLANAVAEQMGVAVAFQPIDWDSKEMELESGNIDCIWNGMSRTPEREAGMKLSQNYLNNKIIIMTSPDVTITDKAQLADYQLGTQAKSSALEVIQADDIYATIQPNLSEYRTYDECLMDLQAGRIQVMIVDEVLGQYKNNNLATKLNVSTVDFGEDFYVIGFRKADTNLCALVEQALKAVGASGKGSEISQKWFGADLLLPIQ